MPLDEISLRSFLYLLMSPCRWPYSGYVQKGAPMKPNTESVRQDAGGLGFYLIKLTTAAKKISQGILLWRLPKARLLLCRVLLHQPLSAPTQSCSIQRSSGRQAP